MQKNRIDNLGLINTDKEVKFKFNKKTYTGYEGDTLASALLANGVTLVGRSFKYHRPRGIVTAGSEEPNALVTLFSGERQEPNVPATMVPIYDGLEAHSQNCFPSVKYDYMAINNKFSSILVAGFYYKTFMGLGQRGWHFFEHFIRKAAGQGRATNQKGTEKYEQIFDFADVLVIGGGVSGLSSALSASRAGKTVIIVDEKEQFGGYGLTDDSEIDGKKSVDWINSVVAELENNENVKVLSRTVAFGLYDGGNVGCVEKVSDHYLNNDEYTVKQRMRNITAGEVILATGSIERPLVFTNNDLPNVMQAEALNTYIKQYGVCSGNSVVVFTNNDSAYRTVNSLIDAGKTVTVVDTRNVAKNKTAVSLIERGVQIIDTAYIKNVNGSKTAIKSVDVITKAGAKLNISCDLVVSSGGHTPVVNLWSHLYGKPTYNEKICAFVPGKSPKNLKAVGACIGNFDLSDCLSDGYDAGGDKGNSSKVTKSGFACVSVQKIEPLWEVPDEFSASGKKFVDQQHDVSSSDVKLAHREGYRSVEHLKRYTTLGMANDQGKTSNVNALAQMAELQNKSIQDTGTTVFRPPYTPVSIGSLSGVHNGFHMLPERLSPFHNIMLKYGAENFTAGLW
ncbi:MAG: FAD-dependent oxidoreductase, partial [Alphaproteobacteria bacterium]